MLCAMDSGLLLQDIIRHHPRVQPPDIDKSRHALVKGRHDLNITGLLCKGTQISPSL